MPTEPESGRRAPRFSVVLVNYNGREWTGEAVQSVLDQEGVTAEAIVVDNASTDGSREDLEQFVRSSGPVEVRVLPQAANIGFAAGCNRGFEAARGELIVQLNNDAFLEEGALAAADRALAAHPEAGSLALSVRFRDRPGVLNSTGLVVFRDGSGRDRDFELSVPEGPHEPTQTVGATGGAAVWRREVLERIGPLDEDFFMYSEDIDIALRAQRAGYACVYVPDAVVLHRFGASVSREPAGWRIEMAHRNSARVMVRNFGTAALAWGVFAFTARVVTLRLRVGRDESRARAKAVGFMVREWGKLRKQRRAIRALGPDRRVDSWIGRARKG